MFSSFIWLLVGWLAGCCLAAGWMPGCWLADGWLLGLAGYIREDNAATLIVGEKNRNSPICFTMMVTNRLTNVKHIVKV